MRFATISLISAAILVAGCKKTSDGRIVVDRPGDVKVTTKEDTLSLPKINLPKVDMPHIKIHEQVDTVNAPTVGTQKRVVKHPAIEVQKR